MKDAQKPDHVSLITLVGHLREGRFVIPDFQREFEWKPWDIQELMRSIFLDYYIGSLLLWKGRKESFEALACERIYGCPAGNDSREHIVLDGQQRLTAMYYAFLAPDVAAPGRSNRFLYFIRVDRFMEEAYDDAFKYDWTRRGQQLLEDEPAQYESHMFPLAVVGKRNWALPNWVQGYERHWREKAERTSAGGDGTAARHAENARAFGEHLKGITEEYQIAYIELDRTPLTADTNRKVIRHRLPNEYLPELIAENGEPTVRAIVESHFVSPAAFDILLRLPFTPDDFKAFLAERQRTLQDAIEDLLVKERLDLEPRLRELDAQIEAVELALRQAIAQALEDDPARIPNHLQPSIEERLQAAARKNPALDLDRYQTLAGRLEYCDLRELEATITNKTLWPLFQNRFVAKEALAARFGQLAELRNGIRHSRTVDEVTRKDGEAALLWFQQVLIK